MVITEWPGVNE